MSGPPIPHVSNAVTFTPGVSPVGTLPTFDTWATIISQFANSPTITALALDFYAWLDQTADIDAFYNQVMNIKTATGYGLDVWGRILGVTRVLLVSTTPFFGFEEASGDGFFGSFFAGGTSSNNAVLTDSAYQLLLFAKALANISNGSIPSINRILMALFPNRGSAFVIDGLNLTMDYRFTFALSAVEQAIVQSSGVLPRPSGVLATTLPGITLCSGTFIHLTDPNDLTTGNWSRTNVTVSASSLQGPFGDNSGGQIQCSSNGAAFVSQGPITITANTTYSISGYLKAGGGGEQFVVVKFDAGGPLFGVIIDLLNGTIAPTSASGGSVSCSQIAAAGNGWLQFSFAGATTAGGSYNFEVVFAQNSGGTGGGLSGQQIDYYTLGP